MLIAAFVSPRAGQRRIGYLLRGGGCDFGTHTIDLQRWPVSKRVNSSKADADDATFIEPVGLAAA